MVRLIRPTSPLIPPRSRYRYGALPLALHLAWVGAAGFASQVRAETPAPSGALVLPEINVTGEKMDRSLEETTTAVTVLQGEAVESGEAQSVYDLVDQVPNMITHPFGVPNIRGMDGTGNQGRYVFVSGSRPRVSTTVDGVAEPWSGERYLDAGLWDVEQVEVLRGPQSTTQGRNTIGGAIVLKTKDPTFHWEGALRGGYENEDGKYQLAGVFSGPIVEDNLAFRLAVEDLQGNGFIDYPVSAETGRWPWDPSEMERTNFRGKLLWTPQGLDALTAKLTVSHRTNEGEYLNYVSGPNYFDYQLDGDTHNTRYQDTESTTVTADIEYAFSSAWTGYLQLSHADYDASFEAAITDDTTLGFDEQSDTLEARLSYDPAGGNVRGMMGLYLYQRDQEFESGPFDGDDEVTTSALFGEATITLTTPLDLILGGRLEREQQRRDLTAWGIPVDMDEGETLFLPKVGLLYRLSPRTNVGFTVRKGYNPGSVGVDDRTDEVYVYDKEEVVAYELSTHSHWLDNRLRLSTNLFYNQYDGLQANASLGNPDKDGDMRIINVPEGESYGLEIETTALVQSGLELSGSLGLLQTEVTESDHPAIAKGNEFGFAPAVNASLGLSHSLGSGFFYGASANYVGEYYSEVTNEESRKAGDYTIANAHIGYETGDFTVRAYVKNMFDEEVLYFLTRSLDSARVGAPRTFGVVVDYRF